jgi:hypothetical protein
MIDICYRNVCGDVQMGKVYQLQQDYKSALDVSTPNPTVMHTYTHPHREITLL